MATKPINQNSERYSLVKDKWVVNASTIENKVVPLSFNKGIPLDNLKPLIQANGIIVKVGEVYLCSTTTLMDIKESNNPHYDIVQNGSVMVKNKEVVIGKTIKIIELNVDNLTAIITSRDTLNRNAGAIDVVYGPETNKVDGVPQGLIDQINYTLDRGSERPKDEYSIFDFYSLVDYVNNPKATHYKITPLLVQTQQADTIFDPKKLREYLIEVGDKLKLLEIDFNLIQDIFYEAKLPNNPISYTEIEQATPDADTNKIHTVRRYNRSNGTFVDNVLTTTTNKINTDLDSIKSNLQQQNITTQTELQRTQANDAEIQTQLTQRVNELQSALANKKDK